MKATTYIKKFAVVAAVTALAVGAMAGAAFATDSSDETTSDAQATIAGANLDIPTTLPAGGFGTITLTGHADAENAGASGFGNFVVVDPRGTGTGWTVNLEASILTNGTNEMVGSSLTAPQLSAVKLDEGSSVITNASYHVAAPIDTEGGVVMATCATAGEGMGSYTFSAPTAGWNLAVTADEYVGTYSTTITTTLAPRI
jgi:hypothetical protein